MVESNMGRKPEGADGKLKRGLTTVKDIFSRHKRSKGESTEPGIQHHGLGGPQIHFPSIEAPWPDLNFDEDEDTSQTQQDRQDSRRKELPARIVDRSTEQRHTELGRACRLGLRGRYIFVPTMEAPWPDLDFDEDED